MIVLGSRVFRAAEPRHTIKCYMSLASNGPLKMWMSALTLDRLDKFTRDRNAVRTAHLYEGHHALPCKHRLGEPRLSQTVEKQRQVVMEVEALRFDQPSNGRLRMAMVNAYRKITAPVAPREIRLRRLAGTKSACARSRWWLNHLCWRTVQLSGVDCNISLCVAAIRGNGHRRSGAL
jgi:hypothetical protein